MRIFANANYPFMQWRKSAYIISAILIAIGIGAMVRNSAQHGSWMNYGVDFAGGTLVQVGFKKPTNEQELRGVARAAGQSGWEVSRFGSGNEYAVRIPAGEFRQEAGVDARARVEQVLSTRYASDDFRVVRTEAVGPKVGDELQRRALYAILASFAATLLYLAVRFQWRFGLAAIIATGHDLMITLGFLAVTRAEISLGTVAALLTIVGYSLNDTIVVFDRIRENFRKPGAAGDQIASLNRSINETLSRTTLTGGSSLATLFALFFLGGPVIRDFALVLILGILIGTFSSIFVAAPALYEIEKRFPQGPSAPDSPAAHPSRTEGSCLRHVPAWARQRRRKRGPRFRAQAARVALYAGRGEGPSPSRSRTSVRRAANSSSVSTGRRPAVGIG